MITYVKAGSAQQKVALSFVCGLFDDTHDSLKLMPVHDWSDFRTGKFRIPDYGILSHKLLLIRLQESVVNTFLYVDPR